MPTSASTPNGNGSSSHPAIKLPGHQLLNGNSVTPEQLKAKIEKPFLLQSNGMSRNHHNGNGISHSHQQSHTADTTSTSATSDSDALIQNSTSDSSLSWQPLPLITKLSYSVGHVQNDLTASMWFSYLLTYFRRVLVLRQPYAGVLLLIGQLADAVATPVVGYLSDKTRGTAPSAASSDIEQPLLPRSNSSSSSTKRGIGRKVWIAGGVLIVTLSFPFIWHPDIFGFESLTAKVLYFAVFVIFFQFAWATVQVSHMALVPELTPADSERVYLNSARSCFTILSNVSVYGLAFLLFNSATSVNADLGPSDASSFFWLAMLVTAIGIVFSMAFFIGTPESQLRPKKDDHTNMEWWQWFGKLQFWQTAFIYMCTRLMVNVSQVYMPLWLIVSLEAPKTTIAILPLLTFSVGFLSTLASEKLTKMFGSIMLTIFGCSCIVASSALIMLFNDYGYITYIISILLGCGSGCISVSALQLICNLVGDNCESSAFVFGAMSFVDKVANGAAVMIAELLAPDSNSAAVKHHKTFYSDTMSLVPGIAALCAIAMLLTLVFGFAWTRHFAPSSYTAIDDHDNDREDSSATTHTNHVASNA